MSNLTIDQILAEKRQEESPELYGIEKEASSQPAQSSGFSYEEVEKMASILSSAELPKNTESSSDDFNTRIAAALILQDSIASIYKQASDDSDSEMEKKEEMEEEMEEEVEEDDEETKVAAAKVAQFIVGADEKGISHEEIGQFIEKQASKGGSFLKGLKSLMSSTPAKATMGAGALGASGLAGFELGEDATEEKAKQLLPKVLQLGQAQGYRMGARKGFEMGAQATNQAWHNRLKANLGNK